MAERFLRVKRDENVLFELHMNKDEVARVEKSQRSEDNTDLRDEEEVLVVLEPKAERKPAELAAEFPPAGPETPPKPATPARKPAARKPAARKTPAKRKTAAKRKAARKPAAKRSPAKPAERSSAEKK